MGIGRRIKEARENLGLTQNELGEMIGVTGSAITNYEKETSHPKEPVMYKLIDVLRVDANYLFQDVVNIPKQVNDVTLAEYDHIKKYRNLDSHGKEHIDNMLGWETQHMEAMAAQAQRIAELESDQGTKEQAATLIELHPYRNGLYPLPYFRGGISAGSGVFVLGNEATDEIELPDIPEYKGTDYAVDVNGKSMEPDYMDGDIVLVSQKKEMHPGDVGIFIVDGSAYIKELGHTELISRNEDFPNIPIQESNNVVCMGKVIGKLERKKG